MLYSFAFFFPLETQSKCKPVIFSITDLMRFSPAFTRSLVN